MELIQQYLGIYPQLRPLTFILKKFIYSARLFDPYSGGISSYGLILMIVAYLQNDNRERKKSKSHKNDGPLISEILIGFLRFYGFKCNYIGKKICVLDPERAKLEVEAKLFETPLDPIYLTVMDVDQIYNNVTRVGNAGLAAAGEAGDPGPPEREQQRGEGDSQDQVDQDCLRNGLCVHPHQQDLQQ